MHDFSRPGSGRDPVVTADNFLLFRLDVTQPSPAHFVYLLDNHFRCVTSHAVGDAPVQSAKTALAWLEQRVDLILLHFDVDVIDSAEFPLGNFRSYGGAGFEAVMSAVQLFLRCEKVKRCV
jgi:arginase